MLQKMQESNVMGCVKRIGLVVAAVLALSLASVFPSLSQVDQAAAINSQAEIYRNQGRYTDAEPLYKRALLILENSVGRDDPSVAGVLNNLALLYVNQDRYSDAEPLYKRSLAIYEKTFGADHPSVATSLITLLYST